MTKDPVHEDRGHWYFWDETWADRYGPYATEDRARECCSCYANWLDNGIMSERFTVMDYVDESP